MADAKITELTENTTPLPTDLLPIVDDPGGTPATQKIQIGNLVSNSPNLLKNGNFINNSTYGYGASADDWSNSSANPVQGGFPTMTKAELIALLGIADGDIEGLWNLNEASGNATDLSANGYTLTDRNSVTSNADGLMASNRFFTIANSEYLDIADASCSALEMAGSQTWFAYVKPVAIGAHQTIMGKSPSGAANYIRLHLSNGNNFAINCTGLTTNTNANSDIKAEAGKWYFVVGIYDSANSKLKIWVNGVKVEVTASGSHTDTNGDFSIGRLGADNSNYFGGTIANAGVLSVALTDSQVKKLFAATMYRGQKIRRATTNSTLSQALPEDLVERLRGKTITLRASMYQGVASTGQIEIDDGSASASATDATTGSWLTKSITKTISTTATSITLRLKHSTSDGNTWFKEVALHESPILLPYSHSSDDWSRFPRLLKMDIPAVVNGYSFEEGRYYAWTPTFSAYSTMTITSTTTHIARYMISGKSATIQFMAGGTVGGTPTGTIYATPPVIHGASGGAGLNRLAMHGNNNGVDSVPIFVRVDNPYQFFIQGTANWTAGAVLFSLHTVIEID